MASTLDVVNDCLATLGEAPLNTLLEPHEFRGTAQRLLAKASRRIQQTGWWYNLESITLVPNPDGQIVLPSDALKWQSGVRSSDTLVRSEAKPWMVDRGGRLYDTRTRSFVHTESVTGELVRELPFEQTPAVINDYIAAETVLKFQSNFDGDNSRRQELTQAWILARTEAKAENTRQLAVNLIYSNSRLSRIKRVTRQLRNY